LPSDFKTQELKHSYSSHYKLQPVLACGSNKKNMQLPIMICQ